MYQFDLLSNPPTQCLSRCCAHLIPSTSQNWNFLPCWWCLEGQSYPRLPRASQPQSAHGDHRTCTPPQVIQVTEFWCSSLSTLRHCENLN